MSSSSRSPLDAVVRAEWPRIVAGLLRVTGDWDLAEDCVQDATERALLTWPRDGVPDNPASWLTSVARRRALDVLRRRNTESRALEEVALAEQAPRRSMPAVGTPMIGCGCCSRAAIRP